MNQLFAMRRATTCDSQRFVLPPCFRTHNGSSEERPGRSASNSGSGAARGTGVRGDGGSRVVAALLGLGRGEDWGSVSAEKLSCISLRYKLNRPGTELITPSSEPYTEWAPNPTSRFPSQRTAGRRTDRRGRGSARCGPGSQMAGMVN